MAKLSLHFNASFALKKEEIQKILHVAQQGSLKDNSLEDLISKTSLGNAKVNRIKRWAIRSGLVDAQNLGLTDEGKIIVAVDPHLETLLTDWFMHFYLSFGEWQTYPLSADPTSGGGWSYFVYGFLPQNQVFTRQSLLQDFSSVFSEKPQVIEQRLNFILRAYTESKALASCQFITAKNEQYLSGYSCLPNPYLIGYFLAKFWQWEFQDAGTILTESLCKLPMGLSAVLSLKPDQLQEQLNQLEAYHIIEQRRAVPPFQLVRRWDHPLDLLKKAYEFHH